MILSLQCVVCSGQQSGLTWALACVIVVRPDQCWLGGSQRPDHINLQINHYQTIIQIQIAAQLIG